MMLLQVTSAAEDKLFDCDVTHWNTHSAFSYTLLEIPPSHECVFQDLKGS